MNQAIVAGLLGLNSVEIMARVDVCGRCNAPVQYQGALPTFRNSRPQVLDLDGWRHYCPDMGQPLPNPSQEEYCAALGLPPPPPLGPSSRQLFDVAVDEVAEKPAEVLTKPPVRPVPPKPTAAPPAVHRTMRVP